MSEETKAPETKPEAEAEVKAEAKPETAKAEAKPEAAKAEAKPEAAKAEAKPEAAKAEAKPEAAKPAAAKPAAPKEETPEPVDPRVEAANAKLQQIQKRIVAQFGEDVIEEATLAKFQPTFVIKNENWPAVVEYLKVTDDLAFVYAEAMAGTDHMAKGYCEVYLNVHSFVLDMDLALKVRTPRDEASVPSIAHIFSGVNWEEREIYDLVGVNFPGHPDMRRIMLEDYWQGHPLRKDYVVKD